MNDIEQPSDQPEPQQLRPEELLEARMQSARDLLQKNLHERRYDKFTDTELLNTVVADIVPILVPGVISDANAMKSEIADLRAKNEALTTTLEIASFQASQVDGLRAEVERLTVHQGGHAEQIRKIDAELGEVIAGLRGQMETLTTDLDGARDRLRDYDRTFEVLKPALERQMTILDRLGLPNFPNIPDALSDYVEGLLNAPRREPSADPKDRLTAREYRRQQDIQTHLLVELLTNLRLDVARLRREDDDADPEKS